MSASSYYVYILASRHHGTFISASPTTSARGLNCTSGHGSKFVHKYKIFRLVHVEAFSNPQEAIAREKQLKFWKRDWKIKLIEEENPDWNDRSGLI